MCEDIPDGSRDPAKHHIACFGTFHLVEHERHTHRNKNDKKIAGFTSHIYDFAFVCLNVSVSPNGGWGGIYEEKTFLYHGGTWFFKIIIFLTLNLNNIWSGMWSLLSSPVRDIFGPC